MVNCNPRSSNGKNLRPELELIESAQPSPRKFARRKKSIHHHRGTPPCSVCRPTPRSQSKKSYGVYHFPGKTREKGIHHRSRKKGIHHRGLRPRKRKKQGFHGGGVYFFGGVPFCDPGFCLKLIFAGALKAKISQQNSHFLCQFFAEN